jgi:lipoyl(octanoyl) transferase
MKHQHQHSLVHQMPHCLANKPESPSQDDKRMALKAQSLGLVDYATTFAAMQAFTAQRQADTEDELWLCEHPAVFTQGLAGKPEHLLRPGDIPVVQSNRGGQITYHAPGQVVAYPLIDLKRAGYFVKEYVYKLEEAIIRTLAEHGVVGHRVRSAPGIYVRLDDPFGHARLAEAGREGVQADPQGVFSRERLGKIAALGIKLSRHCTYHGLALNVAMDLSPFARINPCGYAGLATVDLASLGVRVSPQDLSEQLARQLQIWLNGH